MKYMHPLNISVIILSGYGLEVLCRQYLAATAGRTESFMRELVTWWKRVSAFEKWWVGGCAMALAVAVAGYFILDSYKPALVKYLLHSGFDTTSAPQIARFAVGEVEWFIFYFALSAVVIAIILGGAFSGRRAVCVWVILARS